MQNRSLLELIQLEFILNCKLLLGKQIIEIRKVTIILYSPLIILILTALGLLFNLYLFKHLASLCRLFLCILFLLFKFIVLLFIGFLDNWLLILSGLFHNSVNDFIELLISHLLSQPCSFGLAQFLFLQREVFHDVLPEVSVFSIFTQWY